MGVSHRIFMKGLMELSVDVSDGTFEVCMGTGFQPGTSAFSANVQISNLGSVDLAEIALRMMETASQYVTDPAWLAKELQKRVPILELKLSRDSELLEEAIRQLPAIENPPHPLLGDRRARLATSIAARKGFDAEIAARKEADTKADADALEFHQEHGAVPATKDKAVVP